MSNDIVVHIHKKLLTGAEVSAEYGWAEATLRYWHHKGIGPRSARIGRRRMYRREDVDRWVAAQFEAEGAA
jgi:DNA-binding transcriptional MerR regulator